MNDIILTEKQSKGLDIAVQRYYDYEPYTCISGYAGSGKSTLVKFIIEALDIPQSDVCFIAYTGKAALEGFANVPGTEIIVFYPEDGVSQVQKL